MEKAVTLPNVESAAETVRNFTIKSSSNEVIPENNDLALAQHSDKVERFTFTIPDGLIKGHDITDCNSVLIHFQNTSKDLTQRSIGIYPVTDLAVTGKTVTLSWLIGEEATRYAGSLIFSIHFARIEEDGKTAYNLPTLAFARVIVGDTVWNSETIEKDHPDIIAEFNARIAELERKVAHGGGGGGGVYFEVDDTLKLENGVLSVNTTRKLEQDNTLPITSAGVFATVGNIEALLKTI